MPRSSVSLIAFSFVVLIAAARLSAQETPGKWILGVWEGEHTGFVTTAQDSTRFTFIEDGGTIRWKMERKNTLGRYWDASGTVTKIDESLVELVGKYDSTNTDSRYLRVTDSPLRYSLRGDEATMQGQAIGANNSVFSVVLRRAK